MSSEDQDQVEGWYLDPFRLHEQRWFSDGRPTRLVRDGGVEGNDPPPSMQVPHPPEEIPEDESGGPDDLKRAGDVEEDKDDPEAGLIPNERLRYYDAAMEAAESTFGIGH